MNALKSLFTFEWKQKFKKIPKTHCITNYFKEKKYKIILFLKFCYENQIKIDSFVREHIVSFAFYSHWARPVRIHAHHLHMNTNVTYTHPVSFMYHDRIEFHPSLPILGVTIAGTLIIINFKNPLKIKRRVLKYRYSITSFAFHAKYAIVAIGTVFSLHIENLWNNSKYFVGGIQSENKKLFAIKGVHNLTFHDTLPILVVAHNFLPFNLTLYAANTNNFRCWEHVYCVKNNHEPVYFKIDYMCFAPNNNNTDVCLVDKEKKNQIYKNIYTGQSVVSNTVHIDTNFLIFHEISPLMQKLNKFLGNKKTFICTHNIQKTCLAILQKTSIVIQPYKRSDSIWSFFVKNQI